MRALLLALVGLLLVPVPAGAGTVCRLADPRIVEASGLVDLGRTMVVQNDSGNPPDLQVVDARTCRTIREVRWATSQVDAEALAPAGRNRVWIGDIGDNDHERTSIALYEVSVSDGGTLEHRTLAYPDGPHDAETLIGWRDRLYVVTKSMEGGFVYRVPVTGRVLQRLAALPVWATDGAAIPGTDVALVRGYGEAFVVRLPAWRTLGSFALPEEKQGESISVGPGRRVRVTSEGEDQPVIQVTLPSWVRQAIRWRGPAEAAYAGASMAPWSS